MSGRQVAPDSGLVIRQPQTPEEHAARDIALTVIASVFAEIHSPRRLAPGTYRGVTVHRRPTPPRTRIVRSAARGRNKHLTERTL